MGYKYVWGVAINMNNYVSYAKSVLFKSPLLVFKLFIYVVVSGLTLFDITAPIASGNKKILMCLYLLSLPPLWKTGFGSK